MINLTKPVIRGEFGQDSKEGCRENLRPTLKLVAPVPSPSSHHGTEAHKHRGHFAIATSQSHIRPTRHFKPQSNHPISTNGGRHFKPQSNYQAPTYTGRHFEPQSSNPIPTNGARHFKPQSNGPTSTNRGRHFKPQDIDLNDPAKIFHITRRGDTSNPHIWKLTSLQTWRLTKKPQIIWMKILQY